MTPPPAHLGPHYDSVPALPPDEAERWVKLAHRGLWASWVLAGLWLATFVLGLEMTPDGEDYLCSEAHPCLDGWPETFGVSVFAAGVVLVPVMIVKFPRAAIALAGLVAVLLPLDPDNGSLPLWFIGLEVLTVASTVMVSALRISAASEQRTIGARHAIQVPGIDLPAVPWSQTRWAQIILGCIAVAIGLTAFTAYRDHEADEHVARAQEIRGPVTKHDSDGFVITVDVGDESVEVDTWDSAGYPIGSDVTVLRDGDWEALKVEPYDPSFVGLALGPLLALAGLFAFDGLRIHRSRRRLHAPHPALVVAVAPGDGPARISTVHDRLELGRMRVVAHLPEPPSELNDEGEAFDHLEADYARPRPAVLHGELVVGGAPLLVVVLEGDQVALSPTGLLHPYPSTPLAAWRSGTVLRPGPSRHATRLRDDQPPAGLISDLSSRRPATFEPAPWFPAAAASAYFALIAICAWVLADPSSSIFELVTSTVFALAIGSAAFRSVTWRAQIDADGVVARVGLTKLKVSWDEIRALPGDSPGTVITKDREVAMLLPLPAESARIFTKGESERLLQSIDAIHRDPSLRPTTVLPDPPPLIPELIVGLAGIPVAVNLAAWFLTH